MENQKLNRFINAVNSVTDKQVADILEDARREESNILSAASAAAEEARRRHLDDNLKVISSKYVRLVSKAELDMKKEILVSREKLTEELFAKVVSQIREFTASDAYIKLLEDRLSSESGYENAEVCLSPEDMKYADKLKKKFGVAVRADESIRYGGFYYIRNDKGTINDRTFDCALKEQHSLFSSRNLLAGQGGAN